MPNQRNGSIGFGLLLELALAFSEPWGGVGSGLGSSSSFGFPDVVVGAFSEAIEMLS
jgi:hypothetical protein